MFNGYTNMLLLAALVRGKGHAGEILDRIDQKERKISLSGVYTQLDRLESHKLVKSWLSEQKTAKGRRHRVFEITAEGERVLQTLDLVRMGGAAHA